MQAIVVSLLAIGLGACTAANVDQQARAIIGGDLAPHETSVVLLVSYPPSQTSLFLCTATVINPTQLLTAAHCVDAPNHPDHTFGVYLGADSADVVLADLLAVKQIDYPSTYVQATSFADIAVVTLEAPLSLAPVALVLDTPQSALVGTPARLVGYGRNDYDNIDSAGPKRSVDTTVAAIEDQFLVIGDATKHMCIGDSGGPGLSLAYDPPRLLGVNSNGPVGCTGASSFTRLDRHKAWLADHVLAPPEPEPDLVTPPVHDLRGVIVDLGETPDLAEDTTKPRQRDDGCQAAPGSLPLSSVFVLFALVARHRRRR